MTKIRGFNPISSRDRPINVDTTSFALVRDAVEVGRIAQLTPEDGGLLAPHFSEHPDTVCLAVSGVPLTGYNYGIYDGLQTGVAVEWSRAPDELVFRPGSGYDCKVNRYVFGVRESDGLVVGYDVTERYSNSTTGQVGDHHTSGEMLFSTYGFDVPNLEQNGQ